MKASRSVDGGCGGGGGRVINHWLRVAPTHRIYGLERLPTMAAVPAWRQRRRPNVEIRKGDAVETLRPDATLIFLFNKFEEERTIRLAEPIRNMNPRPDCDITILYLNWKYVSIFECDPAFEVTVLRLIIAYRSAIKTHTTAATASVAKIP